MNVLICHRFDVNYKKSYNGTFVFTEEELERMEKIDTPGHQGRICHINLDNVKYIEIMRSLYENENLKKDSFKPYKPFKRTKSEEEKLKKKKWTKNIILDSVNDCIESGSTKEFCMCLFVKIKTEFTWYEWNVQKVSAYNFMDRFNRIIIDCPNHNY